MSTCTAFASWALAAGPWEAHLRSWAMVLRGPLPLERRQHGLRLSSRSHRLCSRVSACGLPDVFRAMLGPPSYRQPVAEAFLPLAEASWASSCNVRDLCLNCWGLRSIAGPSRRLRLATLQNTYTNVLMVLAYVCTSLRYSCIGVPTNQTK